VPHFLFVNMRSSVAFAAIVPAVAVFRDLQEHRFEDHLKEFGKVYEAEEHLRRSANFHSNLARVLAHNEEYKAGKHSWYMDMNKFGDWTHEEFKTLLRRHQDKRPSKHMLTASNNTKTMANPSSIDWRTEGKVTPVKDQGGCGSCWAFSAISSVESRYAISSGNLLTLAPQAFVNCVQNPDECGGTGGCEGATMELAFDLSTSVGVPTEANLPYAGRDQTCGSYTVAVQTTGYTKIAENDANALESALAEGPVSVTVAAEPWMLYGGGTFTGCSSGMFASSGSDLDHGVQAVGYTSDYWIVRNSWGASWGEEGYIMISRAADGQTFTDSSPADGVACKPYPASQTVGGECGILFDTSYPTFSSDVVV
jgi:cathepsin L